jgi:hypothetical protein
MMVSMSEQMSAFSMEHLESNNILYEMQHGFRSNRSCESQIISLAHQLAPNNDKNIDVVWTYSFLGVDVVDEFQYAFLKIEMFFMIGCVLVPLSGISVFASDEKDDWNCLFKILAFSVGSVCKTIKTPERNA